MTTRSDQQNTNPNAGMYPTNSQAAGPARMGADPSMQPPPVHPDRARQAGQTVSASIPEHNYASQHNAGVGFGAGRHDIARGASAGTGIGGGIGTSAMHTGGMAGAPGSAAAGGVPPSPPHDAYNDLGTRPAPHFAGYQRDGIDGTRGSVDGGTTGAPAGGAPLATGPGVGSASGSTGANMSGIIGGRVQQAAGIMLGNDMMQAKGLERESRAVAPQNIEKAQNLEQEAKAMRVKASGLHD